MLTIELKSIEAIKATCEEWEDGADSGFHSDGVDFNESLFTSLNSNLTVYKIDSHDEGIVIICKHQGTTVYVSPKWVYKIGGVEIKKDFTESNGYIKLYGKNVLKVVTLEIVDSTTLPLCSECGSTTDNIVVGIKICPSCVEKKTYLNNYSYKPTPNFIGEQLPKDIGAPYYYGIELEYGLKGRKNIGEMMVKYDDTIYLKSDASIQGGDFQAELVSHPHSFKALMGECFITKLPSLKVEERKDTNGCHIHISRTAFIDDKHYAKWYFLMHEMKKINEFIGGRELTNYCTFTPSGKIFKKKKEDRGSNRSVMINESNQDTVECRFFGSTNSADEVRYFVQYLESLIKFTKYSADVVTITKWKEYTYRKSIKYALLIKKLDKYAGSFEGHVEYRPPIIDRGDTSKVSLKNLFDIIEIHTTSGSVYKEIKDIKPIKRGLEFIYNNGSGRDRVTISWEDIKDMVWEH